MILAADDQRELGEIIDEEPMEKPDLERALLEHLSRGDRRRFWRALDHAGLIVFRA